MTASPDADVLLPVEEAALKVALHPYLLLKCVRYAPTPTIGKLAATDVSGKTHFRRSALHAYDAALRAPWVESADEPRPGIPTYFQDLLRHEADFRCALCDSPYASDFAHIVPWAECLHHHPHNLICLCVACHAGYDRDGRISRREVEAAKARLLDRADFGRPVKTDEHATRLSTASELCRSLAPRVLRNGVFFKNFGPRSKLAEELPSVDVADVWERAVEETILPNNDAMVDLLLANRDLCDAVPGLAAAAERLLAHAASYREFRAATNEVHKNFPFPTEFAELVMKVARE